MEAKNIPYPKSRMDDTGPTDFLTLTFSQHLIFFSNAQLSYAFASSNLKGGLV
jgi:hypothetical protein